MNIIIKILIFVNLVLSQNYDLDEFNDLDLEPLQKNSRGEVKLEKPTPKKMILFDDNLYLLDDDFDFGADEFELKKLELNENDLEMAKEYADFLNAFFQNSTQIGSSVNKDNLGYNKPSINPEPKKKIKKQRLKKSTPNKTIQGLPRIAPKTGSLGFGTSAIVGLTIPIGQNLKSFSPGMNLGFRLDSPISFSLVGMASNLGIEIYSSTMGDYSLFNTIGNISIFPSSNIELKGGVGFSNLTQGGNSEPGVISLPFDLNYYLPFDLAGFRIAINLHAQMTMGFPSGNNGSDGGEGATTEFINLGFFINTPFGF